MVNKKTSARSRSKVRPLTEVELEFMNVLWQRGGGTVGDVLEALSGERKLAYTSVSTILRILEQKGVLKTEKGTGRSHTYIPLFSQEEYGALAVESLVTRVFGGAPAALARQLLESDSLRAEDLAEIERLIEEKKGGR